MGWQLVLVFLAGFDKIALVELTELHPIVCIVCHPFIGAMTKSYHWPAGFLKPFAALLGQG